MMRLACVVLALAALISGCASGPAASTGTGVEIDAITPRAFDVGGVHDQVMVWAHNLAGSHANVTWALTDAGGPLPSGWSVHFSPPTLDLAANGARRLAGNAYEYPDWGRSMLQLTIPDQEPAGIHTLRLAGGGATKDLTVTVLGPEARGKLSGQGSNVHVAYDGSFLGTGARFDKGDFDTVLGSGNTVPGFDFGLMGLQLHENRTLVLPPALAYGYDNTDANYAKFNGQWLVFRVQLTSLS